MTPDELLDELRREYPSVRVDRWGDRPAIIYITPDELVALITKHRTEAYELGRNEERPRDAIDL